MMRIRPFLRKDLDDLYAISLATGLAGEDASHVHADPRMIGHIYSAPYGLLDPGLTLVVEDGSSIAGYAAGAVDTRAWENRLEREWWPSLRQAYADPQGSPPETWNADQHRADAIHRPHRVPADIVADYPAHLHLNLLPSQRKQGVGTALFQAWLAAAMDRGARTVHVGVNRTNARGARFWERQGFRDITPPDQGRDGTLWMGRPYDPARPS